MYEIEAEIGGRKVGVSTHGGTTVKIYPERADDGYKAFVEVAAAAASAADKEVIKDPEMPAVLEGKLVFDHHHGLSYKRSACYQAFQWLRRGGGEVSTIITEPPMDADQILAILQLIKGEPAPEPLVEGIDIEDRGSPVALWKALRDGRRELGAAVPVLREVDRVNRKYDGPWFEDGEEMMEPLIEALNRVNEVIEAIKDGDIDPEREAERWTEEFEEWAAKEVEKGEIVEEMEVGGYKTVFVEDISPTAMYVHGYDLVIAHGQGRVTVGISPTTDLNIDLREMFQWLSERHRQGWGGRPDVGGSPKDAQISRKEFESEVIPLIKEWLKRRLE